MQVWLHYKKESMIQEWQLDVLYVLGESVWAMKWSLVALWSNVTGQDNYPNTQAKIQIQNSII